MLDKQQRHSGSIYALFAICSPTTGWKTLLGSIQNQERQSQYNGTVAVGSEEEQGGCAHHCEFLQTSWNCRLLSIYDPGAPNSILVSSPAKLL